MSDLETKVCKASFLFLSDLNIVTINWLEKKCNYNIYHTRKSLCCFNQCSLVFEALIKQVLCQFIVY